MMSVVFVTLKLRNVEMAGVVLRPSQAKGASVGLFMRLFSVKDLDDYFMSQQKTVMAEKYIVPFMTVSSFGPTALYASSILVWDLDGVKDVARL